MAWIVGIDEAGYGPNLGPLVMTSVACRVPDSLAGTDLWRVLKKVVRRPTGRADGRLLVDDSKVVYSPARGLRHLETSVLATLPPTQRSKACLTQYVEWLSPGAQSDLRQEPWYCGDSLLPVVAELDSISKASARFASVCEEKGITWGAVRSVIVCPSRFNSLLDHWGSKGAILGQGLMELIPFNLPVNGSAESVGFVVDKHGGRNTYMAMLQQAIPQGFVVVEEEGMKSSCYRVVGLERSVRLTIEPRADSNHFCVALASMVSKYLRELLMLEFNRFWQTHVPELEPTAGYPGDSDRFLQAIMPAIKRLGIPEATLWRRK